MEVVDDRVTLDERAKALRAAVDAAFAGVTREGGMSWGQSQLIDSYGLSNKIFSKASEPDLTGLQDPLGLASEGFHDTDTAWGDLVADPSWNPRPAAGGFDFLDPIGFRYYLAAAIARSTVNPLELPSPAALSLADDPSASFREHQWSLLTFDQRECVRQFLRYAAALDAPEPDDCLGSDWEDVLQFYWLKEELERDKVVLRAQIEEAFADVRRGNGTSWAEAEIGDNYGRVTGAEFHDRDTCWQDLFDDPEWHHDPGVGGFTFLDAIGFRYYLPAAMIRGLDSGWSMLEFQLRPIGKRKKGREQWSELTAAQRNTIKGFIGFQRKLGDSSGWEDAWEYWNRDW